MSITTLAELKTQVKSFLHRANITDIDSNDNLETLISIGETWIFRNARTPEQEATLSGQIGSDGTLSVPSDYIAMKHCRLNLTPNRYLRMRPAQWIYEQYPLRSASGIPTFIGRDLATFIFGCFPSSTYTVLGTYYKKMTSILSSANALFLAHPDLYLYSSLAVSEAFVKNNPQVQLWVAARQNTLQDANNVNDEGNYGTGMAITQDVAVL